MLTKSLNIYRTALFSLLVAFSLFLQTPVEAKDTEFAFYYQKIESIERLNNNPEPEGWWERGKALVKRGVNSGKRAWEKLVTRNFAPGEGSKKWYSSEDKNIAYNVKRHKVESEEHLLSLMGCKNEKDLSDGQRALLEVYRHSRSEEIQESMKYSYRRRVNVILSDTTGFDNPEKFPHVSDDFWPYSSGYTIQMASGRYDWPSSAAAAKSTFTHEFAHSCDRTIMELRKPYGQDGSHYANELTGPRAAFSEGWAQFNEMLYSEDKVTDFMDRVQKIKIEDKKEAGEYTEVDADSLSGRELLNVEGINALILYRIAREIPDGEAKVFKAFKTTRWRLFRNIEDLLKNLSRKNRGDVAAIGQIVDEMTHGRLTDKELIKLLGRTREAREFVANRGSVEGVQDEQPVDSAADSEDIKVKTQDGNPFSF